jgi:hypothetical protein
MYVRFQKMVKYTSCVSDSILAKLTEYLGVEEFQHYIPLYQLHYELNDKWNSVNLYHTKLSNLSQVNGNVYNNNTPLFFKFSPLLEPHRYLAGDYDNYKHDLPKYKSTTSIPKLSDPLNASYMDAFFYYLSNLTYKEGFLNGNQFFGSFIGKHQNFQFDLQDDISMLEESEFFEQNLNIKFTVNRTIHFRSKSRRQPIITLYDSPPDKELVFDDLVLDNVAPKYSNMSDSSNDLESFEFDISDLEIIKKPKLIVELPQVKINDVPVCKDVPVKEDESDEESCWTDDDDIFASIKSYPVQVIALEKYTETLDYLLEMDSTFGPSQIQSALMQVIMTLLLYQHAFQFTHNDLHSNNIMYMTTTMEFIYYKWNDKIYKVPTFGKLFKIIDYGRAIFTHEDIMYMSDNYKVDGDAYTLYNCEPYYDPSYERVLPNFSFDLCRLGTSMLESIPNKKHAVYTVIRDWCNDDNAESVVFTKSGEERYYEFELYRQIARTVHHHTPEAQLARPLFASYETKETPSDMIDLNKIVASVQQSYT